MILNLLNLLSVDENSITEEVIYESNTVVNQLGEFSVLKKEPFELTVKHMKDHRILMQGETSIVLEFPCDRCLEPVSVSVEIIIEKDINLKEIAKDLDITEETNYIDGFNLDVDKLLYNEILIGWPMKILCSDTCKGVCNTCGQNLNVGTCNCEDTGIDPRMSVIRDVFKDSIL